MTLKSKYIFIRIFFSSVLSSLSCFIIDRHSALSLLSKSTVFFYFCRTLCALFYVINIIIQRKVFIHADIGAQGKDLKGAARGKVFHPYPFGSFGPRGTKIVVLSFKRCAFYFKPTITEVVISVYMSVLLTKLLTTRGELSAM